VDNSELEDNVLIKSDGMPTYNFANVIDDHTMNISHVIRGTEYLSSTPKYNLLYDAFNWQRPIYIHLQPIMRDANSKLSKRKGDPSFEDFLEQGYLTDAIINYIALLGWSSKEDREKYSLPELIQKFDIQGLSKSASIFDAVKMKWLNGVYIKELSASSFFELSLPFLKKAQSNWGIRFNIDLKFLATLLQGRCDLLTDCIQLTEFLKVKNFKSFELEQLFNSKQRTDSALCLEMLPKLIALFKGLDSGCDAHEVLKQFSTDNNYKVAQVMWILRVSITGSAVTPGGATDMLKLFGFKESVKRLQNTLTRLKV
jgi:glutamyl-tRNA synthetase